MDSTQLGKAREDLPRPKGLSVSAPGKVILHGEHSVVYGKLALAVSIDLRTSVRVSYLDAKDPVKLRVHFPDLRTSYEFGMDDLGTAFSAKRPRSRPRPRPAEDSQLDMHLVNNIKDMVSRRYPANIDDMGIVALLYLFLTLKAQDDGLPSTDDLGLDMTVTSQIPIGAGLGSSAAFSVAVAAAFYKHSINQDLELINNNNNNTSFSAISRHGAGNNVKKNDNEATCHDGADDDDSDDGLGSFQMLEQELICKRAFLAEKILHGNPSGIDNSVCAFGGLLTYQSSVGMKPLRAPSNLKILLINTRVFRNTKAQVEKVKIRATRLPKITYKILEAMDEVSHSCLDTLIHLRRLEKEVAKTRLEKERTCFQNLEALIDINHELLSSLGVSHPSLEKVATLAAKRGLHAKLTGAGGGGFAFALLTPGIKTEQVEELKQDFIDSGFDCWETQIGGVGVTTD